ncbi:ATP-binding cassette domain-containing protein [Aurantimonas aggregata]|uniref:ATP-binding cassette domain-containing protein n=1 Tax=Aurantimonas aggregata TaxID=2047720 RepID=A0A6L9MC54_9HYPH|nr:zinc ABC transporter ATP-binding protein AztA [Aurantimonas aggregata]NDV85399.1 ATP-binding cassette domain-containing protein [Aurantimonas aggregata]
MNSTVSMPVVRLDDLTLAYRRHPAVHHVTGSFPGGSLTAIVGPNGAGKSTLLKGIMGLLPPSEGRVHLGGVRRRDIAYLPQASELDRSFPVSVTDLVSLGAWREAGIFGRIKGKALDRVFEAIEAVGLSGFEDRIIGTLSGGQLQRALFARVLVQDSRLLLLDEPFTAIDTRTVLDLLAIVRRWHGERRTVIAVLHDMDLVREHFPQTLLIARELVGWGETDDVLRPERLKEARALSETWNEDPHFGAPRGARRAA